MPVVTELDGGRPRTAPRAGDFQLLLHAAVSSLKSMGAIVEAAVVP